MKQSKAAGIRLRIHPLTGCRAMTMALFSLVLTLGAVGNSEARSDEMLPEFNLPAFDVEAFGIDIVSPTPVRLAAPAVGNRLTNTEITMTFHISKSGWVTMVDDDASPYDNKEFELSCLMHRALRKWRFEPARDKDGNAICVKVKMPVKVVPQETVSSNRLAYLNLNRPVIVAVAGK